ncbi:Decapping and exoribonuclease protein [Nymphon striatum]|nr:Decapping and exoribonuclease protein [Nymphon striatum]
MSTFPKFRDISLYLETFPLFRKPKHIGHYSMDEDGKYKNDDSEKKYLKMDHVQLDKELENPIDLQFDEEKYVKFQKEAWFPLHILLWIRDHKKQVWLEDEKRLNEDFISSGGTFKRIFLAPYSANDANFNIYKLNETFYIRYEREHDFSSSALCYLGHKFELCLTSSVPDGKPHTDEVMVNENRKYYHVKKSKINDYNVMYSVNIDSVEITTDQLGKTEEKGVELTTMSNVITDISTFKFKRYRLLKIWCDAFATGIDKTVCGFRGKKNSVTHLKIFETKNLSEIALQDIPQYKQKHMWRPQVCANFAENFFNFIKSSHVEDGKMYRVTYTMDGDLKIKRAEEIDTQLLPDWYCKEFGNIDE